MKEMLNKALEEEKESLETRRKELELEIAKLTAEQEAVLFRLGHVVALLRESEPSKWIEENKSASQSGQEREEYTDPVEIARQILEEHGTEPIYYRELAAMVIERGGEIGGLDPAMTLVSQLVDDERFVRPFRRGWYALRMHYPKVKSVGVRKKKRVKPVSRR